MLFSSNELHCQQVGVGSHVLAYTVVTERFHTFRNF